MGKGEKKGVYACIAAVVYNGLLIDYILPVFTYCVDGMRRERMVRRKSRGICNT